MLSCLSDSIFDLQHAEYIDIKGFTLNSAKNHGIQIEAFCGDVATSCANACDVIFISKDLAERIRDRATVPLVVINNFMDKKEVEAKFLEYYETVK